MAEEKKEKKEEKAVPNSPMKEEKTIRAYLKVKSFVGYGDAKHDEEVNEFLKTIDNVDRHLNARNAYAIGDKSCVVVWYLEKIAEETPVEEFGIDTSNESEEVKK